MAIATTRRGFHHHGITAVAFAALASTLGMGLAQAQTAPAKPDADMQMVLDAQASLKPKPIETLSAVEARKQASVADGVNKVLKTTSQSTKPQVLVPGVKSQDISIAGATGPIPARVYTPAGRGPFPTIVYYHGGGWVIADKTVYDGGARALAKGANAVVVSVDYRRAPEAKFPAQWDDALAAYKWTAANAAQYKGDPATLALAGESAGGNLAVATAVAARDAGLIKPVHILSVYPVAQTSTDTPSYNTYADAKPLNRPMVKWFVENLTNSPADLKDPRLQLVDANLAGLPPVTIVNAQIDPLLDDGAMLEAALRKAGVPVERKVFDGATHEFFGTGAVVQKGRDAQAFAANRLKAAFGTGM
ncbi:alpha/beta hydrolase [Xylophilus sp. GOD-11R]|uniref:alpha/beta hydrolase n=1 Tax=Xylophilus sp. GOD-11R TaxID=3089814 RepID=UPI00298BFFC8|nr:alpha/beta hydrolase [Xylophilus sp. GOD-11R]WPB57481.1 alpha/beta hydrolase [Xylophilus sp. GOD-11R]